jgi:hypothetical protein
LLVSDPVRSGLRHVSAENTSHIAESRIDMGGDAVHAHSRTESHHSDKKRVLDQILTFFPHDQALHLDIEVQ